MEKYRSGHNGAHSKCVCLNGHVGSNPTFSAKIKTIHPDGLYFLPKVGFERRLLETCQWHVSTAVAFPQKRNPTAQISAPAPYIIQAAGVAQFLFFSCCKSTLSCFFKISSINGNRHISLIPPVNTAICADILMLRQHFF